MGFGWRPKKKGSSTDHDPEKFAGATTPNYSNPALSDPAFVAPAPAPALAPTPEYSTPNRSTAAFPESPRPPPRAATTTSNAHPPSAPPSSSLAVPRNPFSDSNAQLVAHSRSLSPILQGSLEPSRAQSLGPSQVPSQVPSQTSLSNQSSSLDPIPDAQSSRAATPQGEENVFGSEARTSPLPAAQTSEEALPSIPPPKVQTKDSFFTRLYKRFRAGYWPNVEPPLILPTGPTDKEKKTYLHTNRIPLYVFGILSFLSLSAGMWLFVVCSPIFAWFGVVTVALEFYLIVSYLVGVIGKDFDNEAHEKIKATTPITFENAPTVDIFLPCCKEPVEVLENTYKHIKALDWYPEKLNVYVMDDGDLPEVRRLAEKYGFHYSVRDDRPHMRKAGNLRWHFQKTYGEFLTIFDADFCPRPDFIREIIPELMADPKLALVQTPQFFRVTPEQTWVEQGAGAVQELFYRVVQVNRNRWGSSICVGSNAMYRRTALAEDGGTANIGYSEDVHTGFGCVERGWRLLYMPICLATGICPDSPRAFFSQQMRWARGSTSLLTNPRFWKSDLRLIQKVCYLCGFMYYSAVSLSIFISPLPGILLLWVRPEFFKYYNLAFAIPSIVYGLFFYRFWAKAKYGFNVQHIMVIQSYAYLIAIKDHLFGIDLQWVPTGDTRGHKEKAAITASQPETEKDLEASKPKPVKKKKSTKYRNMRILCWIWTIIVFGLMISAVTYRILNGFPWYHTLPLIILNLYNLYLTHPFLVYVG